MKNRLLTLAAVIMTATLISCATVSPSSLKGTAQQKSLALSAPPSSADLALVYIVRDDQFVSSGVPVLVGVDRSRVVTLDNNSFTRVELPEGVYRFRWVVNADDFLSDTSDFSHGNEYITVRTGQLNIVRFIGGAKFDLMPGTLTGKDQLLALTREADYQVSYAPVVREARSDKPSPLPVMSATTVSAKKAISQPPAKPAVPNAEFLALQKQQACKLKNTNWAYTGKACKEGLADGKGSAEDKQGLEFIGTFKAGERVEGEIHQDGRMIFSGSLVNDKPDGNAICLHDDEYEECRYFRGKRIDSLYKMRIENNKLRAEMAQQRRAQSPNTSGSADSGITDYAVDALQKEAADRAADYIFDRFF